MESLCARHITLLNGQKHKILKKKNQKLFCEDIYDQMSVGKYHNRRQAGSEHGY